jgi:hypothetical protein
MRSQESRKATTSNVALSLIFIKKPTRSCPAQTEFGIIWIMSGSINLDPTSNKTAASIPAEEL